jgi:chemotaxis response regulator CheB
MAEAKQARAVLCVRPGEVGDRIRRALKGSGFFDIVAETVDAPGLTDQLQLDYPDVVIVDEDLCDGFPEMFLMQVTGGRPVPALVLTATEAVNKGSSGKMKVSRLGKDVLLKDDLLSKNHVWARLLAVAEGVTSSKHTQTATKLEEMVRAEIARARHSELRPEVTALATWPLDLIILVGGEGSQETLEKLFERLSGVGRVPVLIAVDGDHMVNQRGFETPRLRVERLEGSTELRKTEGFLLAPPDGVVTISPTSVDLEANFDTFDVGHTLTSAASLQSGVLAVLIAGEADLAMALGSVVNATGLAATLDPTDSAHGDGPQAALTWEVVDAALTLSDLAWIIEHAIPRRA